MTTDLLTTMRQRLAEAEQDAKRLREAIRVIEQEDTPKPAERRTTRQSTASKVADTPTTTVVPSGKLMKLVSEQDGLTATALAKTTGGDQKAILALLKELEQSGKLTRTGQRRGTRWHATNAA
jgi:predicted HTH transcriptional regulator